MSSLDIALKKAVTSIPDCLAAGYVDLGSGMLLAIETVDSHPREVIELLATATTDLFQGQNVKLIEQIFRKARGVHEDGRHYFQEVIVNSDNLLHVFLRSKGQNHVGCFVCRKEADLGVVQAKSRMVMPEIEAALLVRAA